MESSLPVARRPRRPEWMKVRAPSPDSRYLEVRELIHGQSLHTICEDARCPNIAECWGRGTATFQILGETCTRACRYCYVNSGKPEHPPDPLEPLGIERDLTLGRDADANAVAMGKGMHQPAPRPQLLPASACSAR